VSVTEPAIFELVINVREEEPTVAVIITDVALVAFQFSVTLCPELIELVFAEKTKVGGVEPLLVLGRLLLEQEDKHNAVAINPRAIPRKQIVVISSCAALNQKSLSTCDRVDARMAADGCCLTRFKSGKDYEFKLT
jgi:hypothetical protein